jgi:hypothetical protein
MMRRLLVLAVSVLMLTSSLTAFGQESPPPSPPPPPPDPPVVHPHAGDLSPVVRAHAGNVGLFFRFGGLATLQASGNARAVAPGFLLTQVGAKFVKNEHWIFPVYFGTALRLQSASPAAGASSTSGDVGLEAGGGLEYHFRIWRRISPFLGFTGGLAYLNPSGSDDWTIGFGFGPGLGVEYYIADRVSLTAQYMAVLQIASQKLGAAGGSLTQVVFQTLAGGALNLTCYF